MKLNLIIISFLLLIVSSLSYAVPITDPANPHNMSSLSVAGSVRALPPSSGGTDQICVFCHTPHAAAPESPLWNRPDPSLMGSFPVYGQDLVIKDNPVESNDGNSEYPSGASRMCLSCHDGATSVGVLLGNQTILMEGGVTSLSAGINLATSHPISFNYDSNVLALLNPADYQLPDGTVDTPLDAAGQMQCTTCHDPHEDTKSLGSYGNLPFWRHQGDAASYDDVCNACHWDTTGGMPAPPTGTPH